MTDFQIWKKALSYEEMVAITTCKAFPEGDLLPWNIDNWITWNNQSDIVKRIEVDPKLFCPKQSPYLFFPGWNAANFEGTDEFCMKFGGKMVNATTRAQLADAMAFLQDLFWNPIWPKNGWHYGAFVTTFTDQKEEGVWTNKDPFQPKPDIIWHMMEPDGETGENCLVYMSAHEGENITSLVGRDFSCCDGCLFPVLCEDVRKFHGKIYGLCKSTSFDTTYTLSQMPSNFDDGGDVRKYFSGNFGWKIVWDNSDKIWRLSSKLSNTTFATQADPSYPLGRKLWSVFNDKCNLVGGTELLYLTFSSCRENEFTCDNGICVPMDKRCDQKEDCKDVSDEKNCITISIDPKKYLKDKPPPALSGNEKAELRISVDLIEILSLAVVEMKITTKYKLQLQWFDPRIVFLNLKENMNLNGLIASELNQIWIPSIIFSNTQADDFSTVDKKTIGVVKRIGPFSLSGLDEKENIYKFSGEVNPILVNRVYETEWICNYDMR